MGCATIGKIKGYVSAEEILNFIRQKYDSNAGSVVARSIERPLTEVTYKYEINSHSESNDSYYYDYGYIIFTHNNEQRRLFYSYNSINSFENLSYYSTLGLSDMVMSETTYISLGYHGESRSIIKELVAQFGGGWVDDNDCDSEPFYPIEVNEDKSIKPVITITKKELYEKFGGVVVIRED